MRLVGVLGAAALLSLAVPGARAAESVPLPFAGGHSIRIIQGYNGGTHLGRSQYGLDLVVAAGSTTGAEVLSPIDGVVSWAQAPRAGNGCMAVALHDGSYSIVLCHVLFGQAFRRGEPIARGQSLGTVGPAGTVGNNGTPHVHLELHRGGQGRGPVPFALPDGLQLEGQDLRASGTRNEHAGRPPLISTNGRGSAGPGEASAPAMRALPPQPAAPTPSAQAAPAAQNPAPSPATAAPPAPAVPSLEQTAATARTYARAAMVEGTHSCLRVRQTPAADALLLDCLPDGMEVPLTGSVERDESHVWREVASKGWAVADYLRRTRGVISGTDSCLNVRDVPSTMGLVVTCLPEGSSITVAEGPVVGDLGEWFRVAGPVSPEQDGWILGAFLD